MRSLVLAQTLQLHSLTYCGHTKQLLTRFSTGHSSNCGAHDSQEHEANLKESLEMWDVHPF